MFPDNSNRVKGAGLSALATITTRFFVYHGYRDCHGFTIGNDRLHEDMVVRFFDIAIDELYLLPVLQSKGKTGRNEGFTGSPFAAGDRDYHLILSPSLHRI